VCLSHAGIVSKRLHGSSCFFAYGRAADYILSCVCLCTTSTSDKHHNICQTASGRYQTGRRGRLAQRFTFCQEQELDLENVVSSTPVQPPGTLFLPAFTTLGLLTPVHSENDSRVLFDCAYHSLLLALLDVSYSGDLQISR